MIMVDIVPSGFDLIVFLDQDEFMEDVQRKQDSLDVLEKGQILKLFTEHREINVGGFRCFACGLGSSLSNYVLREIPLEGLRAYHISCIEVMET